MMVNDKKQSTLILLLVFILFNLTSCSTASPEEPPAVKDVESAAVTSSLANETVTSTVSTSIHIESEIPESSVSETEPVEKIVGIYGETDIPDLPCDTHDWEGRAHDILHKSIFEQGLDSMIFETHTCGDYKISLVGDMVRTDEENFPGWIYSHNLRVELEKNGETIDEGYYNSIVTYGGQYTYERRIPRDKIGSIISIYELEYPVIAMRYYFGDEPERLVKSAVQFGIISDDELECQFFGLCEKSTGVELNGSGIYPITLNTKDDVERIASYFSADEFKILDSRTICDEVAGIKYTFCFENLSADQPKSYYYITETIK